MVVEEEVEVLTVSDALLLAFLVVMIKIKNKNALLFELRVKRCVPASSAGGELSKPGEEKTKPNLQTSPREALTGSDQPDTILHSLQKRNDPHNKVRAAQWISVSEGS